MRVAVGKAAFGCQRSAFRKAASQQVGESEVGIALHAMPTQAKGRLEWGTRRWLVVVAVVMAGWAGLAAAQAPPKTVEDAAVPKALAPYTSCVFPDGLRIVSSDPLAAGVKSRSVETATGMHSIDLVAGERVLFAYPMTDFYANVKVEMLPADGYTALKQTLIGNLHFLESQRGGPSPAEALPAGLHGFEVHGNDRQKLEGGVLGMYLLFDDQAHVATTIDFLNQHAWERKFQTMDAYERLRDNFLRVYTGCVRQNQALER